MEVFTPPSVGGDSESSVPTTVAFVDDASVVITHNLGRFCLVQVLDGDGVQVEATITQTVNAITVEFASNQTGSIVYH